MKRRHIPYILLTIIVGLTVACSSSNEGKLVDIETPYGTMRFELYDDTPRHRDNFLNLVRLGAYDSLLFHRVVRDYLIQGGDPRSRNASADERLGLTNLGDEIDAEIVFPAHYHKRGALAMARQSDAKNPEKRSSGSQFYIVTGRHQTGEEIDNAEVRRDNKTRQEIYIEILKFYEDSLKNLQHEGKAEEMSEMQIRIVERVEMLARDRGLFKYSEEARRDYMVHGGLPQLDGEYTVFGEVVDGLNILDSIEVTAISVPGMRPTRDIWMVVREVN